MMFDASISPSYETGYAQRGDGPPLHPSLQHEFAHGWNPNLGASGNTLFDVAGSADSTLNSATRPVWGSTRIVHGDRWMLNWDGNTNNSYHTPGNLADFKFEEAKRWTIGVFGLMNATGDQRSIFAMWGSPSNRQSLMFATDADPAAVQVHINNDEKITSSTVLVHAQWFSTWLTCNGTATTNDLELKTFDFLGKELSSDLGTHGGDASGINESLLFFGRTSSDEWRGFAGAVYCWTRKLADEEIRIVAADSEAPLRLAEPDFALPSVVAEIITPLEHISFSRRDRIDPIRMM